MSRFGGLDPANTVGGLDPVRLGWLASENGMEDGSFDGWEASPVLGTVLSWENKLPTPIVS